MGHAILEAGSDGDVKLVLERAIALDGLHFHLLKAEEARKTWDLLVRTTRRAVSGDLPKVEVEGRVLDERSQEQFRAAAKELAALLTIRSSDAAS